MKQVKNKYRTGTWLKKQMNAICTNYVLHSTCVANIAKHMWTMLKTT